MPGRGAMSEAGVYTGEPDPEHPTDPPSPSDTNVQRFDLGHFSGSSLLLYLTFTFIVGLSIDVMSMLSPSVVSSTGVVQI